MVGVLRIDVLVLLFCSDCVRRRAICGNASDVRKHATCKDHFISLLHFIGKFPPPSGINLTMLITS